MTHLPWVWLLALPAKSTSRDLDHGQVMVDVFVQRLRNFTRLFCKSRIAKKWRWHTSYVRQWKNLLPTVNFTQCWLSEWHEMLLCAIGRISWLVVLRAAIWEYAGPSVKNPASVWYQLQSDVADKAAKDLFERRYMLTVNGKKLNLKLNN